jgi:phage-related protein
MQVMKSLVFAGSSLEDVRAFPEAVRREVGQQLRRVQAGLEPSDWKPMSSVGAGVREIRVHLNGAWRVLYVAKFGEHIYVLHAFGKKAQRTAKADLDVASARYRAIAQRIK